eukprot:2132482-Alexandrium_andersonii.AAC.1
MIHQPSGGGASIMSMAMARGSPILSEFSTSRRTSASGRANRTIQTSTGKMRKRCDSLPARLSRPFPAPIE